MSIQGTYYYLSIYAGSGHLYISKLYVTQVHDWMMSTYYPLFCFLKWWLQLTLDFSFQFGDYILCRSRLSSWEKHRNRIAHILLWNIADKQCYAVCPPRHPLWSIWLLFQKTRHIVIDDSHGVWIFKKKSNWKD